MGGRPEKSVERIDKAVAKAHRGPEKSVEEIDKAVAKAHRKLMAARESVSAWKVSQAALVVLKADSWESLGVQMQLVPSLNRLIAVEGKVR